MVQQKLAMPNILKYIENIVQRNCIKTDVTSLTNSSDISELLKNEVLFSDLFTVLKHTSHFSFTTRKYDNYLIEDYYNAISSDNENSKLESLADGYDRVLRRSDQPADPRLVLIFSMLLLTRIIDIKMSTQSSFTQEKEYLYSSLEQLQQLLSNDTQFNMAYLEKMINHFISNFFTLALNLILFEGSEERIYKTKEYSANLSKLLPIAMAYYQLLAKFPNPYEQVNALNYFADVIARLVH